MGPTEKHEQEFIEASIEKERIPNHPEYSEYSLPDAEGEALEPGQLRRIIIERTEISQLIGEFWD